MYKFTCKSLIIPYLEEEYLQLLRQFQHELLYYKSLRFVLVKYQFEQLDEGHLGIVKEHEMVKGYHLSYQLNHQLYQRLFFYLKNFNFKIKFI